MGFFTNDPFVVATGGPPVATTKWVTATMVATGGAAMGNAVATGGLPWVVSTGTSCKHRGCFGCKPLFL